jgi:hypothetical protein
MHFSKIHLLLLFFFIILGCEREPIVLQPEESLVVNILLISGEPRQKAVITKVVSNDHTEPSYVDDISLIINDIHFKRNEDYMIRGEGINFSWDYNYYSDSLEVIPGKIYRMKIITLDGDTITGQTIVPNDFDISIDDDLHVQWESQKNVKAYKFSVYKKDDSGNLFPLLDEVVFANNYHIDSGIFSGSGPYWIKITAFDENFYEYVVKEKDQYGITGGLGVFGSAVEIYKNCYIKK